MILLLAACARTPPSPPVPSPPAPSPKERYGCGSTAAATDGAICTRDVWCEFGEVLCACEVGRSCGGVNDDFPGKQGRLVCSTAGVRSNGCPVLIPLPGEPCANPGKRCTWPECRGFTTVACKEGGWQVVEQQIQPPFP